MYRMGILRRWDGSCTRNNRKRLTEVMLLLEIQIQRMTCAGYTVRILCRCEISRCWNITVQMNEVIALTWEQLF